VGARDHARFLAQGGFAAAVEMCNGVGVCRKKLEAPCAPPTWRPGTRSTRRAGGPTPSRGALGPRARRRLHGPAPLRGDGSLSRVQGLQGRVPVQRGHGQDEVRVPPPLLQGQRLPLRNRLFGHIGRLSWWGSRLAPLSNWIVASPPNRWLMEKLAGIDRRRPLPAFARETFTDWFDRRRPPLPLRAAPSSSSTTPSSPTTRRTSVAPPWSCSRPAAIGSSWSIGNAAAGPHLQGNAREAREHARWNIERLAPWVARGVAIVGLEPSCLLTLRE